MRQATSLTRPAATPLSPGRVALPSVPRDLEREEEAWRAYDSLSAMVRAGELELYLILSPPRTLSTVWGKCVAERSAVGLWLNEPLSKFRSGENRVRDSYETILANVRATEPAADGVKRAVLSIITSTLGPDEEARRLFRLSHRVSFLVRNPILALESFLILIGRIVQAVGSAPARKEALLGEGWVQPGTLLDHLADDDPTPWLSHIEHLARIRNYTSLTDRFMHRANAMLDSPAYRLEALSDPAWLSWRDRPREGDRSARLARSLGLGMALLEQAEPALAAFLKEVPNGWLYAWRHLVLLRASAPEKLAGVADASELQLRFDRSIDLLRQRMGLGPAAERPGPLTIADGYAEAYSTTGLTEEVMFARAMASDRIDPPDKAPIALQRFPRFVRDSLGDVFASYLSFLSQGDQLLRPFGGDLSFLRATFLDKQGREQTMERLDPVYAYAKYAVSDGAGRGEAAARSAALRAAWGGHRAYFDMIDEALEDRRGLPA